jgi:hypothetical protein
VLGWFGWVFLLRSRWQWRYLLANFALWDDDTAQKTLETADRSGWIVKFVTPHS